MRLRQQTGWTRMEFREEEKKKTRGRGGSALRCRAGRRPPCLPLIRALLDLFAASVGSPPTPTEVSLFFSLKPLRSPPYLLFLLVCVCVCVSYPHVLVSEDLVEKLSQRPPHLVVLLFACLKLRHTLCYGSPPDALVRFRVGALPRPRTLAHPVHPSSQRWIRFPVFQAFTDLHFDRDGKMASGISPSQLWGGRSGERP